MTKEEIRKELKREATLEMCRRDFYFYCKTLCPKFYKKDRWHLKKICDEIQDFYFNDDEHDILVLNTGPRLGKSYTLQNWNGFLLGKEPESHIMIGTYNEKLSTKFARNVRNKISEEKTESENIVYSDIFPGTKIKYGEAAANLWSVEGSFDSFLSTSPTGTATGFGASLLIVDDLIKDAKESYNPATLEMHWDWFNNTMLSRIEEGGKIIVMATLWNSKDLSSRIVEEFGDRVRILRMKTCLNEETGEMICPSLLSFKKYKDKISRMNPAIASANYQQICIDSENRLYKNIKTYDFHDYCEQFITYLDKKDKNKTTYSSNIEKKRNLEVYSYCDTADEGSDYLCNIIFSFDFTTRRAYVLDVYYTQDGMETTERETAERLNLWDVRNSRIESNNGGRGFARNVQRILQENYKNYRNIISWFHQSDNKLSRIRAGATQVCEFVYFPTDWYLRWPEFYRDINQFDSNGNNQHDDSADALTGVIETLIIIGGI